MNEFEVSELKENTYFTAEVFLDKTFVLLNNFTPVTRDLLKELTDWRFLKVYSAGQVTDKAPSKGPRPAPAAVPADDADADAAALEPLDEDGAEEEDDEEIAEIKKTYKEFLAYITSVYTFYSTHKKFDIEELSQKLRDLCLFVKDHKSDVLRITPTQEEVTKNYLANHSLRSTITAIAVGLQLRMPLPKLIELGIACLLHEIGMIRLPPQLYMTDKELSQADRRQLFTHPVISFQILRDADFSQAIQLGVLQHHEKENGTGYPQHKTGDKISLYAKIIGVACTFEAITASRHYKESKNPYDAMMELLKNEGNQYDPAILKAMLYTYSLFPIGEYVYLQNGKVGQVIDVNPESPKNPIVEIPGEYDENGNLVRIQTNDTDIKIVRVLTRKEREDMLATLQTKRRPLPKRP